MKSVIEYLINVWLEVKRLYVQERNRLTPSARRSHLCAGCGVDSVHLLNPWGMTLHCSICGLELVWWAQA